MKKFFTLAIVAMIASVSFGQTFKSTQKLEKTTATFQKEALASSATTQHKVAPNAADVTEFVATSASAQYYSSDGDWYVVLAGSSTAFRFDVVTNNPAPLELGHTYTLDDMDEGYSWYGSSSSDAVGYTAATLTPKQGAEGTDYEATATLTNGKSYHITYTATAPKTYDVKITEVQSKYYGAPDYDWYFGFGNNDYTFYFDIANQDASGIVLNKVYTLADMIEDYSWGKVLANESQITYKSVSFKATEGATGTDYAVTIVDTKGDTYNLTYTSQALPEPTDTVEIVFTSAETELVDASSSQGLVQFQGAKANGVEAFITFFTDQVAGEYTMNDVASDYTGLFLDETDDSYVAPLDIKATVTAFDGGAYKAVVDYLGANAVLYKLTFNFRDVPVVKEPQITGISIKGEDVELEDGVYNYSLTLNEDFTNEDVVVTTKDADDYSVAITVEDAPMLTADEYVVTIELVKDGVAAVTYKVNVTVEKATGINDINVVNTKTYKAIKNGQVVIVKGEKMFNVLGQPVR